MNIHTFDDLIRVACSEPMPQRLLLVFAQAELPDDSTPEQRQRFEAGEGGTLAPIMCVDKAALELTSFQNLANEAAQLGVKWQIMFAAAMQCAAGQLGADASVQQALERMVAQVKAGQIQAYVPFDCHGEAVVLG